MEKIRTLAAKEVLDTAEGAPPLIAFISQIMAANPKEVPGWLEALSNLKES